MRLKNIDILQWCVSDIFARYQWLKHEHPDELIKYTFAWIPAMFLLVLTYYKIQGLYHWLLHIVLGDYINRHKTIQRGSQSTQHMLCGHVQLPSRYRICTNVYGYSSKPTQATHCTALQNQVGMQQEIKHTYFFWNQSSSLMTEAEPTWITPTVLKNKYSYTFSRG